jgi:hypothetical protein
MKLGPRILMTKNLKKIEAKKNLIVLNSKIAIYLSLGLPKGHPKKVPGTVPYGIGTGSC